MYFGILGSLDVRVEGRPLTVGGTRSQLLLAGLLLQAGRTVVVNELADLLWDGDPPATARKQIQTAVFQVRRALGITTADLLHTDSVGYRLSVSERQVDLHQFSGMVLNAREFASRGDPVRAVEEFRAALRLWRGQPLAGLPGSVIERHATRLEELRLTAIEECTEIELRLGRHRQLIPELRALADALPLRERATGLLMTALAGDGRQAEAITVYHDRAAVLREQLGVDPGPFLNAAYVELLRGAQSPARTETTPTALDGRSASPRKSVRASDHEPASPAADQNFRAVAAAGTDGARRAGRRGTQEDSAGPLVPPAQLPVDVRGFAGRAEMLVQLDNHVGNSATASGTVVIIALSGTAGVGKTALAVHWAHRVAHRFPDGQLYINLHGFGPLDDAVTTGEAVRTLLDGLGVPAHRVPTGVDACAALYRSVMAGRRVLVLLDNARDAAQIRPLLPATPGCIVLVTSRNNLSGLVAREGAVPLTIDVLPRADARSLLAARLGPVRLEQEPAAVEQVIDRCAGLPLALAIAAARAVADGWRTLAQVADTLAGAEEHLDPFVGSDITTDIRTVFMWSYRQLRIPAARLFRLLGICPGDTVAVAVAVSLTGTPVDSVTAALRELVEVHLLHEVGPGRFGFHDLLRTFAHEQATADPDTPAALRRLLDHYLHTATAATAQLDRFRRTLPLPTLAPGVIAESFPGKEPAMSWFAAEYRALLASVSLAAASDDPGVTPHPARIASSLEDFQQRTGRWGDALAAHRIAVVAARRRGDRLGEGLAEYGMTRAHAYLGDADNAGEAGLRAAAIYRDARLPIAEAAVYGAVSVALARANRHTEALVHAQRQADLCAAHGTAADQAHGLNTYGFTLAELGRYDEALDPLVRALDLQKSIDNQHGAAFTLDSLGLVYLQLGRLQEADAHYRQSLDLFEQASDRYGVVYPLCGLGDAAAARGEPETARLLYQRAMSACQEADQHHLRSVIDGRLGGPG
ncbi:AfsR/SARP family transcriptional regulator [Micromonospora sp. DT228]|uniref:AfsR/SARP family transcriptional regulator n=1 Tax=Micromonospora sp. DT228 TaxID=3393443 RepID=UPI003CF83044